MIDNNTTASNNLSNNNVASGNFSQNTLVSFNVDFKGLENTVGLIIPSVRNVMIERYRAETFYKIGMKTEEIIKLLGIDIHPIPPKAALPLFEKASLEHEENMYDLWAKLLVGAINKYNPIQLQYAEILSKIGCEEANILRTVFNYQSCYHGWQTEEYYDKDINIEKNNIERIALANNLEIGILKYSNYKNDETEDAGYIAEIRGLEDFDNKPDYSYLYKIYGKTDNCTLQELTNYEYINSLDLLQSLNLLKYDYVPYWKIPKYINEQKTHLRMFLTSFGYRFILSLETYQNSDIDYYGMST